MKLNARITTLNHQNQFTKINYKNRKTDVPCPLIRSMIV